MACATDAERGMAEAVANAYRANPVAVVTPGEHASPLERAPS